MAGNQLALPAGGHGARLTIVIVEDDAIIGSLLQDMLEELGHEVCCIVATEAAAVAASASYKPGLMIVDAGLEEGGGVVAMQRILATGYVPHVFVSGQDMTLQVIDRRAAMVRKPFFEADLVRAITRALAA